MPKFSDRFKQLRTERRLSQQNLADQLGFSKSSVNMYERGEREPGLESMETIADYFNVDLDYLMGRSDIPNRNDWLKSINKSVVVEPSQPQMKFDNIIPISTKRFPLLGDIACGKPIMANEEKEQYVEAGTNIHADFCLKAKGDSMIGARIYDGDIVFIRKQEMVNNGEIAAVIIDDEATLKRVNYYPEKNLLILKAENSNYEDLVYTGEQLDHIIILGMKKKGCLIPVLIVVVALAVGIGVGVSQMTNNPGSTNKETVPVVFDALQYEVKDKKNISETELIEQLGEPDRTEDWNYTTASGKTFPIRTLYYGNNEYSFNNDNLQRVTLYDKFSYSSKDDFLPMFNLKKYSNTNINDTGSYYRAFYCGVNDLWLEYNDSEITMTKISYGSVFDEG